MVVKNESKFSLPTRRDLMWEGVGGAMALGAFAAFDSLFGYKPALSPSFQEVDEQIRRNRYITGRSANLNSREIILVMPEAKELLGQKSRARQINSLQNYFEISSLGLQGIMFGERADKNYVNKLSQHAQGYSSVGLLEGAMNQFRYVSSAKYGMPAQSVWNNGNVDDFLVANPIFNFAVQEGFVVFGIESNKIGKAVEELEKVYNLCGNYLHKLGQMQHMQESYELLSELKKNPGSINAQKDFEESDAMLQKRYAVLVAEKVQLEQYLMVSMKVCDLPFDFEAINLPDKLLANYPKIDVVELSKLKLNVEELANTIARQRVEDSGEESAHNIVRQAVRTPTAVIPVISNIENTKSLMKELEVLKCSYIEVYHPI